MSSQTEKQHGTEWCGRNGCTKCEQPGWEDCPPVCPVCGGRVSPDCVACGWKPEIKEPEPAVTG